MPIVKSILFVNEKLLVEAQGLLKDKCVFSDNRKMEHTVPRTKTRYVFADTMTCTRTQYLLCAACLFHGNSQTFVHQGGDCHTQFPSRWYTLLGTDHRWVSHCFVEQSGGTALRALPARQGGQRRILPRCEHPSQSSHPRHRSPSAIQRNATQLT